MLKEPPVARDLVIYTIVHQPRRLKLPAQPIPDGASIADIRRCLFDEALDERYFRKAAAASYYPATELFTGLARAGLRLAIALSRSFILQAEQWDPPLLDRFRQLIAEPNIELIGAEPYHSFLPLLDMPAFIMHMRAMRDDLERRFGKRPMVTDTTEMYMSPGVYHALERAGFSGAFMDGRPWVLQWRSPTYLYHYQGGRLRLLTRHPALSDDVGYRFANRAWPGWPLLAPTYARWLRETPGDLVFIGWDFETFGEHHRRDTGIFAFMERLPEELHLLGMRSLTPGEALACHGTAAHDLPLPPFPTTWAGSGGIEFFLGNAAQQALFQLMIQVYAVAHLTRQPDLIDCAHWLLQSDNLHLIQWFGRTGAEAAVSAYFTPREWWDLGAEGIIREQQRVYQNFLRALAWHLPGHRPRTPRAKGAPGGQERIPGKEKN
jgi:alpha-amylase